MSNTPAFLSHLGLDLSADERAIRRAYAQRLKQIDQETDLPGFQRLRECYEAALNWARHQAQLAQQASEPAEPPDEVATVVPAEPAPPLLAEPEASAPEEVRAPDNAEPEAPVPDEAPPGPDVQAHAVFHAFMTALQAKPFTDKLSALTALDKSLADERLINLDARDYFEWFMAQALVQGWRPGHEALFVATTERFDWGRDPQRLQRFGRIGQFINNALTERQGYGHQSGATQEAQRRLIVQLRKPAHPGPSRVLKDLPHLEQLGRTFPHWLTIIAPLDRLVQWREWDAAIPRWRRRLTYQSAVPEIKAEQPKSSGKSPFWLAILAMMVIGQLARLGHDDAPPRYAESYRRPSQPPVESAWSRPPAMPLETLDPAAPRHRANDIDKLYPNLQAVSGPLPQDVHMPVEAGSPKPKAKAAPPTFTPEPYPVTIRNPKAELNPQFDVGRYATVPLMASPGQAASAPAPVPASPPTPAYRLSTKPDTSPQIDASMPPVDYSLPSTPR